MWTAVGHDSVLNVSTIPRVGFKARLAIPVLKDLDVISRIAVPVVSEPVPAVVGTTICNSDQRQWTCIQDTHLL